MITFSILLGIVLIIALVLATCGAGLLAVFGDLIVCGLIIVGIVKLFGLFKKK